MAAVVLVIFILIFGALAEVGKSGSTDLGSMSLVIGVPVGIFLILALLGVR